jgi:hypothetical protein
MAIWHGHAGERLAPRTPRLAPSGTAGLLRSPLVFAASLVLAAGVSAAAVGYAQMAPAGGTAVPTAVPTRPAPRAPAPALLALAPGRVILVGADGRSLADGSWLTGTQVTLRVSLLGAARASAMRAEAEIVPVGVPFTGTPNAFGAPLRLPAGGTAMTRITAGGLLDGCTYRWRTRSRLGTGQISPWLDGGTFGVSASQPLPPSLAVSNVRIGGWSRAPRPLFRVSAGQGPAPLAYFDYRVLARGSSDFTRHAQWQRMIGAVLALPAWPEGSWQVQVRAMNQAGNQSPSAVWNFGLARTPPPPPRLLAANPANGALSNAQTPTATLAYADFQVPMHAMEYRTAVSGSAPGAWQRMRGVGITLPDAVSGSWKVWVRAVDAAGNVSSPAIWRFTLDREHPYISGPRLSTGSFTEPVERQALSLGLGKAAVLRYDVFAQGAKQPLLTRDLGLHQAGPVRNLRWDGSVGTGKLAPPGNYYLVVSAVDAAGNRSQARSATFTILNKRFYISIGKEELWAYEGTRLMVHTLVTNGGPDTPTIPGFYHVEAKEYHLVMHSPWPKTSPLYYAPSPTNYALLYNANGGYFLHDAPWRWHFGPGSNSVAGQPGGSYTGTHGCTNIPLDIMQEIYSWADVGTLVQFVS